MISRLKEKVEELEKKVIPPVAYDVNDERTIHEMKQRIADQSKIIARSDTILIYYHPSSYEIEYQFEIWRMMFLGGDSAGKNDSEVIIGMNRKVLF